jgi:hypothetical protein
MLMYIFGWMYRRRPIFGRGVSVLIANYVVVIIV